jgi:hypothetical protein
LSLVRDRSFGEIILPLLRRPLLRNPASQQFSNSTTPINNPSTKWL